MNFGRNSANIWGFFHLYFYTLALMSYFPKANILGICKLLHTPCAFKTTGHKVHGNKKANLKSLDELSGTASVTITNSSVNWEHDQIEGISYLLDVLEFSQVLLFIFLRINLAKLHAPDCSTLIVISQESGIPVIEVTSMEDTFTSYLYNP